MSFFIQSLTDHTKTTENCDDKITGEKILIIDCVLLALTKGTLSQSAWLGSHKQDSLTNKEPTHNYAFFAQEYSLCFHNQNIHFGIYYFALFGQESSILLLNQPLQKIIKACLDRTIFS